VSHADLERLKLAFAYYLSEQVVDADGRVRPGEAAFLERSFPREKLFEHGLLDDDGQWTTMFSATVEEALRVLPVELSADEKNELMHVLRAASDADADAEDTEAGSSSGTADPQEVEEAEDNVLIVAARLLGMNPADWIGG